MNHRLAVLAVLLTAACCVPAHAESQAQLGLEMKLADAGFRMRTANTPRQLERLRTVPPRRFIARTRDGVRHYLYADPDGCKCALIGTEHAMQTYRSMVSPPPLAPGVKDFEGRGDYGVDPVRDIIHEQHEDAESRYTDDIFHPGF